MKYLIELIYRKCWDDGELRNYVRTHLMDLDTSDFNQDPERLMAVVDVLDALAAKCLGESDDLPPPPI